MDINDPPSHQSVRTVGASPSDAFERVRRVLASTQMDPRDVNVYVCIRMRHDASECV